MRVITVDFKSKRLVSVSDAPKPVESPLEELDRIMMQDMRDRPDAWIRRDQYLKRFLRMFG